MIFFFHWQTLQAEKKSSKVATKGAKQIVEENVSTLNFYRNMVFAAVAIYLTIMMVFFSFNALEIVSSATKIAPVQILFIQNFNYVFFYIFL